MAFLFLGELFLIPHLLPIALALARRGGAPAITLFVVTSIHEEIVRETIDRLGLSGVGVRRARGFRRFPAGSRDTPALPHKIGILARNAIAILRHDVVVVAERTSLWLPRIAGFGARFVYNEHGAGPHANFATGRNRAAARILMPGAGMAQHARAAGDADAPIALVGYIKRDFLRECPPRPLPAFPEQRPTVIYVPHWLRGKSSWWAIGEQLLDHFARSDRYNLILAPHIRLPRFDADFERRVAPYRACPNIHVDATSFALVDQTYLDGADLYLGDGSSQVVEFAERPRPAIFLNPDRIDWQADPRFTHWTMGDVVTNIATLDRALAEAQDRHRLYAPIQRAYVDRMMGPDDRLASTRAADVIAELLAEGRPPKPKPIAPPRSTIDHDTRSG